MFMSMSISGPATVEATVNSPDNAVGNLSADSSDPETVTVGTMVEYQQPHLVSNND